MARQQKTEQELEFEAAFTAEPSNWWGSFGTVCIILGIIWFGYSLSDMKSITSAMALTLMQSMYLWPPMLILFGGVLCGVGHLSAIRFYARQAKRREIYLLRYGQGQNGVQS